MQNFPKNKLIGVLFVPLLLAACATVRVTEPAHITEKVGQVPEINQVADATVGSTVFSQFRYWSKTGYRLAEPVSFHVMLSSVHVEPGEFIMPAEAGGEQAYCTERNVYVDPMVGPFKPACFIDSTGSGRFNSVKVAPGAVWFKSEINPGVRYTKGELVIARPDATKKELIYEGYSGRAIRMSYREYLNDFARPAFFQDVTYDVAEFPTTITFKTVRIRVIQANNNGLQYEVLSGF